MKWKDLKKALELQGLDDESDITMIDFEEGIPFQVVKDSNFSFGNPKLDSWSIFTADMD